MRNELEDQNGVLRRKLEQERRQIEEQGKIKLREQKAILTAIMDSESKEEELLLQEQERTASQLTSQQTKITEKYHKILLDLYAK